MNKSYNWDELLSQIERSHSVGTPTNPAILQELNQNKDYAHEDEADIKAGLAWGREKKRLLRWVRSRMNLTLSRVQRESITLCYFEDKTVRDAAVIVGCHYSTVSRAVKRAVKKLKEHAEKHAVTYRPKYRLKKKKSYTFNRFPNSDREA